MIRYFIFASKRQHRAQGSAFLAPMLAFQVTCTRRTK